MENNCFELVDGVYVPNLDGIHEGYSAQKTDRYAMFTINVSAANIRELLRRLFSCVTTPGYLILEIPTNENIEKDLRKKDSDPFHSDVFYMDGTDHGEFFQVFAEYEELLINDGLIKKAPPGEYRFKSIGKVVVNPHLMTNWTIHEPPQAHDGSTNVE